MANSGDVQVLFSIKVEGDKELKQYQKSIKDLQTATTKADNSIKNFTLTSEKGKGATASFGDRVAKATAKFGPMAVGIQLITKAVNLAFTAFQAFGKFLLEAPFAFAEAEKASNRLAASLQQQGIASNHVKGMYKNFADEMRNFSGIATSTTNDLLTLATNNGLFGQKAMEAVRAAHSLSLGLNIDLHSAMTKIVGAYQNGVEELNRYKLGLVATGDSAKDFENALKTIQDRYGQLAGADADNLITKTQVLKANWSEFKELLGKELAPVMNQIVEFGNEFLKDLSYMNNRTAEQKKYAQNLERIRELEKEINEADEQSFKYEVEHGAKLAAINYRIVNQKQEARMKEIEAIKTENAELEKQFEQQMQNASAEKKQAEEELAAAEKKHAKEVENRKIQEEAKKAREKELQAEQQLAKRVSDFKLQQETETLKQISSLRSASNALEASERYNQYRTDYETKIEYLRQQVNQIRDAAGEEIAAASEVNLQKQILQEEYQSFLTASREAIQEQGNVFAEFDVWLTTNATQRKIAVLKSFTAFQQSNIKALQVLGKASAIATTTIDTYKMAVEAYSAMAGIPIIGPALGAAAAAAAIAFGLEQIANIAGVQFASGTDFVPKDMQATVHQGEIIIPKTFAEAIRAGDLTLSGGVNSTTENNQNSQVVNYNFAFNVEGDVVTDGSDSLAEKIKEKISEGIASGRYTPFPVKERM